MNGYCVTLVSRDFHPPRNGFLLCEGEILSIVLGRGKGEIGKWG